MNPEGLAGLSARALRGQFYRVVREERREQLLSPEGSLLYGGRYNAPSTFGVLYCAERPDVATAEIRRGAGASLLKPSFVMGTLEVDLRRVLDLTDPEILAQLDVRPGDLVTPSYALTQELARLAREAGFEGLVVPSATGLGRNLVLFTDHLDPSSVVRFVAVAPAEV